VTKIYAQLQPHVAGIASTFELALRFVQWATQLRTVPTAQQICEQFNVSRPTAYRWRAAWLAVQGIATPSRSARHDAPLSR
jgi:transposase-like protein